MSYDLFFRARNPQQQLKQEDFNRYFENRKNFQVQGAQAWYGNEDSGIYFVFDYGEQSLDEDDEATQSAPLSPVTFNINYFRPHPFGLEAEPEVQAFVRHFDLTVSDPQLSGMGEGEYSSEGFLSGWNNGNEFGYRAMMSHEDMPDVMTLPSAIIEQTWRWNFSRIEKQAELGNSVFVPKIFYANDSGKIRTAIAWADGIPILLPQVDLLIVPRFELAPKRWFRAAQDDMIMLTWSEVEPMLSKYDSFHEPFIAFKLFYDTIPPEIEKLIRSKAALDIPFKSESFDQVLNRELIVKVKALN